MTRRAPKPPEPIHAFQDIGNGLFQDIADGRIYNAAGYPVISP